MDTFEKLEYRIKAGIREAEDEKARRLSDRVKLPLKGLNGEDIFITDLKILEHKAQQLKKVYADIPGIQDYLIPLKNSRRILMTSVVSQPAFVSPYRGRIQSLIGRCVKKKYAEMKPGDQAEA